MLYCVHETTRWQYEHCFFHASHRPSHAIPGWKQEPSIRAPPANTGHTLNLSRAVPIVTRLRDMFPRISGSKSQSALWNAITAGMGIKGKPPKPPLDDPRSPEEILADEFPAADVPEATEKTAIRSAVTLPHRPFFADSKHTQAA